MDGIGNKLLICVWVAAKECHLCAFLNLAKKDFGGIYGQVGAAENGIVCLEDNQRRLAIDCAQLIQYIYDAHAGMPTLNCGII
jgi:hypothetical protein